MMTGKKNDTSNPNYHKYSCHKYIGNFPSVPSSERRDLIPVQYSSHSFHEWNRNCRRIGGKFPAQKSKNPIGKELQTIRNNTGNELSPKRIPRAMWKEDGPFVSDFSFFFSPSLPLSISPEARKKRRTRKKQRGSGENSKTPSLSFVVDAFSWCAPGVIFLPAPVDPVLRVHLHKPGRALVCDRVRECGHRVCAPIRTSVASICAAIVPYIPCLPLFVEPTKRRAKRKLRKEDRTRKKRFDCSIEMRQSFRRLWKLLSKRSMEFSFSF